MIQHTSKNDKANCIDKEKAAAICAAGGIPEGWQYIKPIWSKPPSAKIAAGIKPKIIGALVGRVAKLGSASVYEVAEKSYDWLKTPVFVEVA